MAVYGEVKKRLFHLLREQQIFEEDPETIIDKDLIEHGLIDSLTITQMRSLVEEEFHIMLNERLMIEKLNTLDAIIAYLAENVQ